MKGSDILLIIVAILLPPLAVFFIAGCGCDLLINIVLTCFGYFPGHIHAFWLIYRKIKAERMYGVGGYTYGGRGVFSKGPGVGAGPGVGGPGLGTVPVAQPGYGATATY